MNVKKRIFKSLVTVAGLILLTSCMPSGNVVGSAQFSTISSNFSDPGDITYLDVNGGVVVTPNGIRTRLNKAKFSIPSKGIFLTASRFRDVSTDNIPKSIITDARLKGKNTCAYVTGTFDDGQDFAAFIYLEPLTNKPTILLGASAGGEYVGQLSSGKLQIGGRNLCG